MVVRSFYFIFTPDKNLKLILLLCTVIGLTRKPLPNQTYTSNKRQEKSWRRSPKKKRIYEEMDDDDDDESGREKKSFHTQLQVVLQLGTPYIHLPSDLSVFSFNVCPWVFSRRTGRAAAHQGAGPERGRVDEHPAHGHVRREDPRRRIKGRVQAVAGAAKRSAKFSTKLRGKYISSSLLA